MKTEHYIGQGAFFDPPIVISDSATKLGKPPSKFMRKIVCKYENPDGFRVFVTDDGYVCPFLKNNTESWKFLNTLFAVFITKFQRAEFVRKLELTPFIWEESSDEVDINRVRFGRSYRNEFEIRRDSADYFELWQSHKRQNIDKYFMERLIDVAYRFYKNDEFRDDLILIGESHGMYSNELYGASVISSWTVIEIILHKIWINYIKTLKKTKESQRGLKNKNSLTASQYMKNLSFVKILKKPNYDCLTKLKKLRNDLVHGKKRNATKEQAWNSLSVAIYMLYNHLNQTDPFLDVEYKKIPT